MRRGKRLAAGVCCAALLLGTGAAEAGSLWRPQRQVRSLEAGDPLAERLFGKTTRRAWRNPRREGAAAAAPVDLDGWLSRWGAERAETQGGAPERRGEPAEPAGR